MRSASNLAISSGVALETAPGTTEGNAMIGSGMLASAIAAAPIRYAEPHHASARTLRCCSQSMIKKDAEKACNAHGHQR